MARNSGPVRASEISVRMALFIASVLSCTLAQNGFTSIDCGLDGNSVDNAYFDELGIRWVSDSGFVSSGANAKFPHELNDTTVDNYQALQSFRYFPEPTNKVKKHCYVLPAQDGTSLIRATFYYEKFPLLPLPIMFNLSIDATIVLTLLITDENVDDYTTDFNAAIFGGLVTPYTYEGIFNSTRPPGESIHLCLLQILGIPFISSIEMRSLQDDGVALYADNIMGDAQYLETYWRLNCGENESTSLRYPDDRFDRIWVTDDEFDSSLYTSGAGADSSDGRVSYNQSLNSVPPRVMASALVETNLSAGGFSINIDVLPEYVKSVYMAFYFEELNLTTTGVRGMAITAIYAEDGTYDPITSSNGLEEKIPVNVSASPQLIERHDVPIVNHTDEFILEFIPQPWSKLGAQLNAMEFFIQYSFNTSKTAPTDAAALETVKESFGLTNWSGDPCLPISWEWIQCDSNFLAQFRRVTKIFLSNYQINGSIPSSIPNMDALTEIHLDNNNLIGKIPDSLGRLPKLAVLLLNNNKLTGTVPSSLTSKPGLIFSYADNDLSQKNKLSVGAIVGFVVGGVLILIILAGIVTWSLCIQKRRKSGSLYRPSGGVVSLKAVLAATNNNSNKIGVGSYGSVYYGYLDGKDVAVKVNGIHSDQRNQEFITEVDILTRVHHRNLVSLLGYCNEGQQLILIYEYQANGTLREWLYNENNEPPRGILEWSQRLQIAVDAAKGLEYLHKNCVPPIIHRDVKSSNILLDDELVGKVADFGVSKSTLRKWKADSFSSLDQNTELYHNREGGGYHTMVKGTFGYLDPEYQDTKFLSPKCDVYSFGVVLAELISGKPAVATKDETTIFLMDELHECVVRDELEVVADPHLNYDYDKESMLKVANIALACVRLNGEERPDISEVVRSLEMVKPRAKRGLQETMPFNVTSYPPSYSGHTTGSDINGSIPKSTISSDSHIVRWGSVTTYF